jgi:hypothetical protein
MKFLNHENNVIKAGRKHLTIADSRYNEGAMYL